MKEGKSPEDMLLMGFGGAFAANAEEAGKLKGQGFDVRGLSASGKTVYLRFG